MLIMLTVTVEGQTGWRKKKEKCCENKIMSPHWKKKHLCILGKRNNRCSESAEIVQTHLPGKITGSPLAGHTPPPLPLPPSLSNGHCKRTFAPKEGWKDVGMDRRREGGREAREAREQSCRTQLEKWRVGNKRGLVWKDEYEAEHFSTMSQRIPAN